MHAKPAIAVILLMLFAAAACLGQTSGPASAPTTTRARYVLLVPPGFKSITVGNHTAIIEPADEQWVKAALGSLVPTTLPTTMPSDLLEQVPKAKANIKSQMIKDLALTDPSVIDKFFSETLEPQLRRYDEIQPPLFYMVITNARLLQLIKGGWSDPRFYYNRAADAVQVSKNVSISSDGPADDVLVPIIVEADWDAKKRTESMHAVINNIESSLAAQLADLALVGVQVSFINFIGKEVFTPLKLKDGQEWLSWGVSANLSVRYASQLNKIDPQLIIRNMSGDPPRNPIRAVTVDLLRPTPIPEMRPEAVPFYRDAYQRKSMRVVSDWMAKTGDSAVPKLLAALRKNVPEDSAGLVKLIQQETGIDLTAAAQAGS